VRDGDDIVFTSVVVDASKGKDQLVASVTSGIKGLLGTSLIDINDATVI
jgi:hypothetical protein